MTNQDNVCSGAPVLLLGFTTRFILIRAQPTQHYSQYTERIHIFIIINFNFTTLLPDMLLHKNQLYNNANSLNKR